MTDYAIKTAVIVALKIVFDVSGNTGIGITLGRESLQLIREESVKY